MSEENKKIPDLSEGVYIKMLNEVYTKIGEERDLALDRYREQDEQMEDDEDFILQGKIAISYLSHASTRTDALFNIAKEIKSIIFSDGGGDSSANSSAAVSDEKRRLMAEIIKQTQREQQDKEELEHDEDLINGVPDKDDLEDND